jgi:hypothetical protein
MAATVPQKNTWEPEHESLLLETISSRGIFVSRSGSTQMEGNRAKMGSIVSEFNEAVRQCNKQIIARINVLQKEYDGNMARHAAIPAGTKGKGHVPKKPTELKGFKPPRDSYDEAPMTSKWVNLQSTYQKTVSQYQIRPYQSKGESGGGGDSSMAQKIDEAQKSFRHFSFFHQNFGNMPKLNPGLIAESGQGEPF